MTVTVARKNAVIAGLRPWLREEQIALALEALDAEPGFNLQRFADWVCERLAPRCDRRELHRSLVQSVFLGEEGATPAETGDAAQSRVFAGLLGAFMRGLAAQRSPADATVRDYLLGKIDRFGLSGAARNELVQWLGGRRSDLTAPLGSDAMRQMVNVSYVLACEAVGPVIADQLLARAVKEADALPEARRFPARALL